MASAYDHLGAKMQAALDIYKAPAMMAALVRAGGNYAVAAVKGVRKADVPASKIQDNDAFCLGSVSKPVSGYLLAYLSQQIENVINPDVKIRDIFTELESSACRKHYNIRSNYLNATIAQMMSHSAGFPYTPSNTMDYILEVQNLKTMINSDFQAEYCTDAALMQRRYNYAISSQQDAPVTGYVYNGGPILPAAMVERVMGKTFEKLLEDMVFQPLGMTNAGTGRTATSATPDGVWEHSYDKNTKKFVPVEKRTFKTNNYHSHAPAGGIYFSATDAIKFITALFPNSKPKQVVQNTMLAEMYPTFANGFSKYGWITSGSGNSLRVSHDGDNGSCRCRLTVWPNRGEGYIVCTNGNGTDPSGNTSDCFDQDINGNKTGANTGCKTINPVAVEMENMLTNWQSMFPNG